MEGLVGVRDVARMLGMSSDWVYRTARRGLLPYFRVGGSLRFRVSDIEAWLVSRAGREPDRATLGEASTGEAAPRA